MWYVRVHVMLKESVNERKLQITTLLLCEFHCLVLINAEVQSTCMKRDHLASVF